MLVRQKLAFRAYCLRHRHLYRLFSRFFRRRTNRALRRARRARGIDGNLALFCAYRMQAYCDNPRYISEALHALRPETDIAWMFRNVAKARERFDIPGYVRCVQWDSPDGIEALARARVLVDNWRKPDYLRLGRGQVYLFSPHHDRSFKHGYLSTPNHVYGRMLETKADAATTGSAFCKEMLAAGYHFHGKTIDAGQPRNDILMRDDPADAAKIRKRLGIDAATGILLYAPTFRDADTEAGRRQRVPLNLPHVLDVLEQTTGRRWMCLWRAHYLSLGLAGVGRSPRVVDATDYPEMAELLRVADALITDYSSCAGDFALRGKPIWLYQDDIDAYRAHSRALYVDMDATPYWKVRTPEELDDLIRRTTPEAAAANCRAILDFYHTWETGKAAEAAARYICEKLG